MPENTLERFTYTPPAATSRDDSDIGRALLDWLLHRETALRSVRVVAGPSPTFFTRQGLRPLVTQDDQGNLVVSDEVGAAYGVGATYGEAFAAWTESAREHYLDLRAAEHRLHPRMLRQLEYLRGVFG